jgi:hypothetical protein
MTAAGRQSGPCCPAARQAAPICRRPPPAGRPEGGSACQLTKTLPRQRRVLSKDRIERFSDGFFGFAATLLVLDLAVHPPGTPAAAGAAHLAWLPGLPRQLPDHRRSVAPAHRLDRPARPGRSAVPAAQPALPARGGPLRMWRSRSGITLRPRWRTRTITDDSSAGRVRLSSSAVSACQRPSAERGPQRTVKWTSICKHPASGLSPGAGTVLLQTLAAKASDGRIESRGWSGDAPARSRALSGGYLT